jgi:chemotaxis protein MotB
MPVQEEAPPPPVKEKPIIVIRKKVSGHGGHHGGAWKVAYADFVTAMMALFIVLWLTSADEEVKKAVAGYFNDPTGQGKLAGLAAAGLGHAIEIPKDDMVKLREKIQQALAQTPNFKSLEDNVEITITADGLRIELLETDAGMFFESGKAVPTETGADLLARLAAELGKMPNTMLIEGHTDSKPFASENGYSNWELSSDRANSARKLMEGHGLRPEQVNQVRGYADRELRHPEDPNRASNRRISVIVQYLPPPPGEDADKEAAGEASKEGAAKGEAAKGDAKKAEAPKGEAAKGEAKKGEAPKGEAAKGEAKKGEAPKGEAAKGDAKKGEAPKGEAAKGDAKKAEAPKAEAKKASPFEAPAPKTAPRTGPKTGQGAAPKK